MHIHSMCIILQVHSLYSLLQKSSRFSSLLFLFAFVLIRNNVLKFAFMKIFFYKNLLSVVEASCFFLLNKTKKKLMTLNKQYCLITSLCGVFFSNQNKMNFVFCPENEAQLFKCFDGKQCLFSNEFQFCSSHNTERKHVAGMNNKSI